jgi:hypothetical protein
MSYYDTMDDDLKRARHILANGKAQVPDFVLDEAIAADVSNASGGTIYGADNYAAYKLLESFVGEIERLQKIEREHGALRRELRDIETVLHELGNPDLLGDTLARAVVQDFKKVEQGWGDAIEANKKLLAELNRVDCKEDLLRAELARRGKRG